MCLFHILNCSAHDSTELRRILTWPSREIVAAGLVRCKWHEAITRDGPDLQTSSKFQDPDAACPYVVVRHDEVPLPEDVIKGIVEAVYLECIPDRGCAECEETILVHDMLGPLPTKAEKLKCLRASGWVGSFAVDKLGAAPQAGVRAGVRANQKASGEEYEARGMKRAHGHGKDAKQNRCDEGGDDDEDEDEDEDIRMIEERHVKKARKAISPRNDVQGKDRTVSLLPAVSSKEPPRKPTASQPADSPVGKTTPPARRERVRPSSPAAPPSSPAGKGKDLNLSDAALYGLTQNLRPARQRHLGNAREDDALQRRKEELRIALATQLSMSAHRPGRAGISQKASGAGKSDKERKETKAPAVSQPWPCLKLAHDTNLATRGPSAGPPRSQTEPAEEPSPPPPLSSSSSSSGNREGVIRERVREAFECLDSAAQQKDPRAHDTEEAEDGEFGPEVLRGVRDGSFQTAVEELSRKNWDLDAPLTASEAGGGRKGKIDTLRDSVRILRSEKAAFVDRIAGLLEEKAAAVQREAALLRRVVELERIVHASDTG